MNEIKKVIKIFLASSIDELRDERNELGRFILGINNINLERGIYCYLDLCENDDNAISSLNSKQEDYNRFIQEEADAVFVLFHNKAGQYTMEELELAKRCFKVNGRPRVYTYFKNFNEGNLSPQVKKAYDIIANEYKHFFGTFENIASVEVDILRAMFEICGDELLKVSEENGKVYFGGREIMSADTLDYIQNNNAIEKLKRKIAGLKGGDEEYTCDLYGDEIDDEIEKCEKQLRDRYQKCFKALEDRYNSISSQATADYELQSAYNASARGDYKKVVEILDRSKLQFDMEKAIKEKTVSQRTFIESTLSKYKQRINALMQIKDIGELESTYSDMVRAINELHLYELDISCLELWHDFVLLLKDQNRTKRAIETAERLYLKYLENLSKIKDTQIAELLTCMGLLHIDENSFEKAEKYCLEAEKIYERLSGPGADKYKHRLSECYYALASLYYYQVTEDGNGDSEFYRRALSRSEEYDIKTLKIREALAKENPGRYNSALAQSYNGISLFYEKQKSFDRAMECHLRAIKIAEAEAQIDPGKNRGDLSKYYYTMGRFLVGQGELSDAEYYLLRSVEMREQLTEENARRYNADLAKSYSDTGILYKEKNDLDKAEEYFLKAIKIREALARENPERYNCYLVISYSLYAELKQDEEYFLKAYNIGRRALHNTNSKSVYDRLRARFEG